MTEDTPTPPPVSESRDDVPTNSKKEKTKSHQFKKKPWHSKSGTASSIKAVTHTGIKEMNGHVFSCPGETSNATQFKRTCEELETYCTVHMKSYGDDIAQLVRTLDDVKIGLPIDPITKLKDPK